METVSLLQWAFDLALVFALLWLAWRALSSEDLFKGIVLFIAFGLLMALVWVRFNAPDIALAEAGIGAGLTGALLLAALAKLESETPAASTMKVENKVADSNSSTLLVNHTSRTSNNLKWFGLLPALLLSCLAAGLGYAVLNMPLAFSGLSATVASNLDASGVENPVTAVLLNFRAYDTLLELAVLLLALLAVWSLGDMHNRSESKLGESKPGEVQDMLVRALLPMFILVAGYLLWVGGNAPGGAFQAGAVLAAAGVLMFLTGWQPDAKLIGWPLRVSLVFGLAVFVVVAMVMILPGGYFLQYPQSLAPALILLIEAAATVSIGVALAALFIGGRPQPGSSSSWSLNHLASGKLASDKLTRNKLTRNKLIRSKNQKNSVDDSRYSPNKQKSEES